MDTNYQKLFYLKTLKSFFPDQLIQKWLSVHDSIDEGFNDIEDELDYDLSIRDIIESMINDKELKESESHKKFIQENREY